jgi:hypothetical protein
MSKPKKKRKYPLTQAEKRKRAAKRAARAAHDARIRRLFAARAARTRRRTKAAARADRNAVRRTKAYLARRARAPHHCGRCRACKATEAKILSLFSNRLPITQSIQSVMIETLSPDESMIALAALTCWLEDTQAVDGRLFAVAKRLIRSVRPERKVDPEEMLLLATIEQARAAGKLALA